MACREDLLAFLKEWLKERGEPIPTARLDKCKDFTLRLILFEPIEYAREILAEEAHAINMGLNVEYCLSKFVKNMKYRNIGGA